MSRKQSEELKSLQSLLAQAKGRLAGLKIEKNNLSQEINQTKQRVNSINQKIANLHKDDKDIILTEHALLRYIERVIGIDLNEIEQLILPDEIKEVIKTLGNCTYPADGFKLKVKDNKVITILVD